MSAEAIVCASHVCRAWRRRAISQVHHVEANMDADPDLTIPRSTGSSLILLRQPRAPVLLTFCDILDTVSDEAALLDYLTVRSFDLQDLTNIKYFRSRYDERDGMRVLHVKSSSMAHSTASSYSWLRSLDMTRIVFVIRDVRWDVSRRIDVYDEFPEHFDSLVFTYLPGPECTDIVYRPDWYSSHWNALRDIIARTWERGKAVTIVNVDSLKDYEQWMLPPTWGRTVEDMLRRWGYGALDLYGPSIPPGPVCPVHFVTLEDYRAHVGEYEFAIDTEPGWITPWAAS